MSELFPTAHGRYRATVLREARVTARGVEHVVDGERRVLLWERVRGALAADVGEPEGVRTIVFDLRVDTDAGGPAVCRLDAEPGEAAMELARRIEAGLGGERCSPSIKSLAGDGIPTRWYPDLPSFEADAARELLSDPSRTTC